MVKKPELYVGCGLTGAPKEFVNQVEALKERLDDDWEVLQFLGLGEAQPGDVYRKDILENVRGCKAFLGVIDERAWGLGYETAKAEEWNKPTLLVARVSSHITRLALDVPLFVPNTHLMRYEDMLEDVPRMAREDLIPRIS